MARLLFPVEYYIWKADPSNEQKAEAAGRAMSEYFGKMWPIAICWVIAIGGVAACLVLLCFKLITL